MNKSLTGVLAVAALAGLASGSAPAATTCKEKLAEVDARLAVADLGPTGAGLRQMRDQAATMCRQGEDAMALQILGLLDMSLPATQSERAIAAQADRESKAALTNEFLAGTWCSMTGEERSQLVFNVNGTYRYCLHDAVQGPYGACSREPRSTAEWLARYPRAKTVERDLIVIGGKGGRNAYSTFRRGACSRYGR